MHDLFTSVSLSLSLLLFPLPFIIGETHDCSQLQCIMGAIKLVKIKTLLTCALKYEQDSPWWTNEKKRDRKRDLDILFLCSTLPEKNYHYCYPMLISDQHLIFRIHPALTNQNHWRKVSHLKCFANTYKDPDMHSCQSCPNHKDKNLHHLSGT